MTTTDEDDGLYWDYVWEEQQDAFWESRGDEEERQHDQGNCNPDCWRCAAEDPE